jgi:hypothetical protein
VITVSFPVCHGCSLRPYKNKFWWYYYVNPGSFSQAWLNSPIGERFLLLLKDADFWFGFGIRVGWGGAIKWEIKFMESFELSAEVDNNSL